MFHIVDTEKFIGFAISVSLIIIGIINHDSTFGLIGMGGLIYLSGTE